MRRLARVMIETESGSLSLRMRMAVYHTNRADHSIKLHVGMPADNQLRVHSGEDRRESIFLRKTSKYFNFASWCSVAKQYWPQGSNAHRQGLGPA